MMLVRFVLDERLTLRISALGVPLSAGELLLAKKHPIKQDHSELRTFSRMTITRRGVLTAEDDASALTTLDERFPCLIEDMSHGGFLLVCTEQFSVGQVLHFSCELLPEQVLECKIKVMNFSDSIIGAKIVDIDYRGIELCKFFLRDQILAQRLKKSKESGSSAVANRKTSRA